MMTVVNRDADPPLFIPQYCISWINKSDFKSCDKLDSSMDSSWDSTEINEAKTEINFSTNGIGAK